MYARRKYSTKNHPPFVRRQRLRNVQGLLQSDQTGNVSLDAIVIIVGLDSKYNEGCRELADYLLFDFFSQDHIGFEKEGLEEEDVDDVIIVVQSDSVSVYCGARLYEYLLPLISHWMNLQIFCQLQSIKDENRDTDAEEKFKVESFVEMVDGCSSIGIPILLSSIASHRQSDLLTLEKWPLMQLYPLQETSRGELFTTKYAVRNIRELLLPLYYLCDPVVLEKTVSKSFPLFVRHWNEAVAVIQNAANANVIPQLQEDSILEPLYCYYKHGQFSKKRLSEGTNKQSVDRQQYVLFGTRSSEHSNRKSLQSSSLKAAGGKGKNTANHMVIQCCAPQSPISCTRTYFFLPEDTKGCRECGDVVHLYSLCVEASSIGISEFTISRNSSKAEKKALDYILSKGITGSLVFDAKCKIVALDMAGREVNIGDDGAIRLMKVIHVAAENIKTSHDGINIGSVLFSDTFLDSSFYTLGDAHVSEKGVDTAYAIVTHTIPNYYEWQVKLTPSDDKLTNVQPLATCENLTVCSNSPLYSPPCQVSLVFNLNGTISLKLGGLPLKTIQSEILFFDGKYSGKVGLIVIDLDLPQNISLLKSVGQHMRSEIVLTPDLKPRKCLILALMPRTNASKEFYAKVALKVQTVKVLEKLPPDLAFIYQKIQELLEQGANPNRDTFQENRSELHLRFSEFMKHYSVSSAVGEFPVAQPSVGILLKNEQSSPVKEFEDKICITLLTGLPCSGANQLSQQIVKLNKEKVRWVIIRANPMQQEQVSAVMLDKDNLQDLLAQAVAPKRVSRTGGAARKKLRIIVLAEGFFDLCDVIQCIISHRDMNIRKQMFIGAVTTCVQPKSVFIENRQTFPKFNEQCLPGLVNNFALSTLAIEAADSMDKDLSTVQTLLRTMNQHAAFLICHNGELLRQEDFELVLSENGFETSNMIRDRQLLNPALSLGMHRSSCCKQNIQSTVIEFSQPVIKGTFCAKLRALKSSLSSSQETGRVYFVIGFLAFTESPNQEYELHFTTLTGEIELTPRLPHSHVPTPPSESKSAIKPKYNIHFYGMDLSIKNLKMWIRKCGRQKASKICHKTINTLSKDEWKYIHEQNRLKPLPEGYFFNGSFYVNLFNSEKTLNHPDSNRFADAYVINKNKEIDAYNARIDQQNTKDVFGE